MRLLRRLALLLLAIAVLAGCATADTNSDEKAVVYSAGGWGEDTTYDECSGPNINDYYSPGSLVYVYPMGQRTYEFSGAEDAEQDRITVVTKDGVRMTAGGLLNFTLADDCKVLRRFHEKIGLKYEAGKGDDSGFRAADWRDLLRKYLGTPLVDAMISEAKNFTWRELYSDQTKREEYLAAVRKQLPEDIKEFAEGDYFGGFTLKIPAIEPPAELLRQITEQQVQAERVTTIDAQAAAQAAEIEQMRQLVDLLGPGGYIAYRNQIACEQNADNCVPFLPLPQGSDLNVTPGG